MRERERESRDDYWYVTNSRDFVVLLGANWVIYITKIMLLNTYLWIKLPEKKNMAIPGPVPGNGKVTGNY